MSEFIGVKDPIGNGQFNMYVTDEPIVRCGRCRFRKPSVVFDGLPVLCPLINHYMSADGFCSLGEEES